MKLKFGRKGLAGVFLAFMFAWGIFPCFSNAGVLDTVVASTYLGGSQSDECYSIAYDSEGNVFVAGKTASLADLGTGIQNVYETYKGQQDDVFVAKFDASLKNLLAVTYLGGSGWEGAHDLFVDASDKVFVTGYTTSSDFPVTAGAYDTNFGGVKDAFVAKFSNDLSVLEASTFLGGAGEDISYSIVIDSFFDVFIAGSTRSADFPAAGGYSGGADGFLAKLTNDLSVLTAATYMGGTGDDYARAVSLDAGNILVAGNTRSAAFTPAISGANMGSDDIFAARFDTNLNCQGGTYAGGSLNDFASDIAADSAGNIFITGRTASFDFPVPGGWDISHNLGGYDAFALKLNSNFVLQSGTYLGGTGYDFASALAVDGADNVLIAGSTGSTNFPPESIHSGGGYDAFALMLSNDLGTLTSSSILGGSGQDDEFAITLGAGGTIYVAGRTASTDFPALNAWDLDYNGGDFDAFVARFGMNLVSIPDMTGGGIVEIPVNVFVATGIAGFEFKITYDPNVLNAVGVLKGTLLGDNWNIIGNTDVAGQVIVAGHSNDAEGLGPVTDGSLVKLVFAVVGAGGSTTNLTFIEGLLLNPFVKVLETGYDNGLFTVEAGGGTLKVTIAPQEAIDAGAQWSIDGANWFDSGFTLYLAPGGYTVQYTNMENWYVPTNQDVTMTSGGAEERTGTYSRHQGTLDVVIEPEAARNAGVLWSIDGGVTGYPSGGQQVNTGTYTLTYSDLAGWDKPADVPGVVVLEGQTTGPLTGTYVQHLGSLTVTIAPQGAIDAGAQWSIDGGTAWNDSGATMTGIQVGTYTVTYKQVGNWNEPAGEDVVINRDQETTEDGTYVRQTGTLTVTIEPQGARDAGAQWSMDEGTTWNNSGVTTGALETGPFAVTFSGIQGGFGTPADILVNLQQGPNNVTGRYTWTWTVDPSGGGDFTTIQAAIDGSAPGDTILVVPGTYNEFLNINKDNLIIRSTGGASVTTVNVQTRTAQQGGVIGGVVFYNNGITLDGFTIQDMTVQSGEIKVIRIEGNQNTLTNCVVRGNIYYTATNKTDYGILVYGSDNTISGNEIYDIGYTGINVVAGPWSDAEGNTISNNILHDIGTADAFSYGITIDRSGNNKLNIVANQFYNLLGGDAKSWAMVVWGQMAEGTNISGHNITNVPNGISLASACGVLVANNTIQVSNVGMRLFYSSWAGPVVDNNVIVSNTITGGTTGFLINPNGGTGVIGANNLFAYNNIYGNTTGAENLGTVAFDARNNWWGDATGPYHATNNPQGLGNPVSDYIIFDPMLGAPVSGGGILDFDNPSYENGDAGLGVDISFAGGEEGTAVVTLLGANPTDNELFDGSFFDVFLSDPGDISEVKIKLYYNEPSAKVAYWFNGTTWVECSDQQVVAGAVTVGGEDYDGYVEVTINSSTDPSLADLTATYFALRDSELYKGRLTVAITPQGAVVAGAQWSIDGTNWYDSGDYLNFLDTGTYTVSFKGGVAGYMPPADIQVDVVDGETDSLTGNYFSVLTVDQANGPFYTIQSAINASNAGDTILVMAGTYAENLTVVAGKENIKLIGSGSNNTNLTITTGYAINTTVPITVEGFHVSGPARGTGTAIYVRGATGGNPQGSGTEDNPGIFRNNKVSNLNYGLQHGDWNVSWWEFTGNDFSMIRIGIGLQNMKNVKIADNIFADYKEGISFTYGPGTAENVDIFNNIFSNDGRAYATDSVAAIVIGSAAKNINVFGNTINSSIAGVLVKGPNSGFESDIDTILVNWNNIVGNDTGVENQAATAVPVNALNNWWGDASGPAHATNPTGTGDPVTDKVMYDPWLGSPVTGGDVLNYENQTYENGDAGLGVDLQFTGGTAGTAIVTILGGNPTDVDMFDGSFFDVFISELGDISEVVIKLYYNEPSAKVAYWFNGTTWVECSLQQVVVGPFNVDGVDYEGYVQVTINDTTVPSLANLTGTYFALRDSDINKGALTVTISPQDAIDAGARWTVDGGTTWYSSGDTVELVVGSYTLQYKQINTMPWAKPADETITITKDGVVVTEGIYVLLGDVNGDGVVDITDVILALRMAVELPVEVNGVQSVPYPDWLILRADYNQDSDVNISDVMLILRKAIGLE